MKTIVLLAAGGAIGTLSRYFLSGVVQRMGGDRFVWGTLAVNALGCFLFGLVWSLMEERGVFSSQTQLLLLPGFMGAFTTFSTYMYETAGYLDDSQWGLAATNVVAQNLVGLVCVFGGFALVRLWVH